MKTMMELLIRLQQLRRCCERTARNHQLTDGEKDSIRVFKCLVRDCLPREVLRRYDQMKEAEPELLLCPEVFSMAVLVSTYRGLSRRKRTQLANYFATQPSIGCGCNAKVATRSTQPRARRAQAPRRSLVARN